MSRIQLTRLAVAITAVLLPAMLSAQEIRSGANYSGYNQANSLRAQAIALYDAPARAAEVAKLHLEEVQHRAANDPLAVEALFMAAFFFKYAGRQFDARKTLEQVAERTLANGDVMEAAQAYLEAAGLAQAANQMSETRRLAEKASLLSDSPLLKLEQRTWIRNQIQSAPSLASLVR